jgi:hypothetical protein
LGCPWFNFTRETYDTGDMARRFGAYDRGMIPRFVPDGARNIYSARKSDTGAAWVRCELPQSAIGPISAAVRHVGWAQAREHTEPAPGFLGAWHPALEQTLAYTPEAGSIYFVYHDSGEWHGVIAMPKRECFAYRLPSR